MISLAADLIEMSMSHVPCYVSIYVRRCFVEWMRPLLCVVEVRFLYLGVAGVTITANRLPCCCSVRLLYKLVCFGLCIGWMVRERFLGGLCNISVQVFLVHTHVSEGVGNAEKGSCVRISVAQTALSCRGSGSLS